MCSARVAADAGEPADTVLRAAERTGRRDDAAVTPLRPPTGIALSALIQLGPRVWPGIALGSLCVVATLED
ncbi:hypothetical protein ACFYXM_27365 [Streptomyces sp. NPDC002476]|uniref:hypothetical protein n=1 Tax=Streptomyces sp. NPDC002476 TaxID=3364648 RepID=UPI003673E823